MRTHLLEFWAKIGMSTTSKRRTVSKACPLMPKQWFQQYFFTADFIVPPNNQRSNDYSILTTLQTAPKMLLSNAVSCR